MTPSPTKGKQASTTSSCSDDNYQPKDQLLIGGLNIDGLKNNSELIKSLILSYQFDIFVITETQLISKGSLTTTTEQKGAAKDRTDPDEPEDEYKLDGYVHQQFARPKIAKTEVGNKGSSADPDEGEGKNKGKAGDKDDDEKGSDPELDKRKAEDYGNGKDNIVKNAKSEAGDKRGKDGGGILVYYRKELGKPALSLVHRPISNIQIFSLLFSTPVQLHLLSVYNPPNANSIPKKDQNNVPKLAGVLKDVNALKSAAPVVLFGDFNLNPSDGNDSVVIKEIEKLTISKQIVEDVTRVHFKHYKTSKDAASRDQISHTLLDHIYVGSQAVPDIISSGVKRFGMSDHDLIFCNIKALGFNPTRAHQEKSIAVREMEDVKQRFIDGYESCAKLNALTYYGHEREEIQDTWAIFKDRKERVTKKKESYSNDKLSAARKAKTKCHEETDLHCLKELHRVGEESFCAPCSIRKKDTKH